MSGEATGTASSVGSPPEAPGSLGTPPRPAQVLTYLSELGTWRDQLGASLRELDRRARASTDPDAFTGDITLAMSLWESIDRRTRELVAAWDSGRVLEPELAKLAQLIWGRLPDPLGNPSAFSLSEATTLAAALEARLASRLGADALAGSGVADRLDPLRDTLARCVAMAATLGRHDGDAEALRAELDAALDGTAPADLAAAVGSVGSRAEVLERDLIKETSLRSSVERSIAAIAGRIATLVAAHDEVEALAARCRAKIVAPPRLAVPDVAVLGPGPTLPDGSGEPGTWTAAASEAGAFTARLDGVAAALDEARRRYAAPLDERAELRGVLGAYADRAAKAGLAEDPALGAAHAVARDLLWTAPCDLDRARPAVRTYLESVRARVGADAVTDGGSR